jgi:hypothetical protein
VEFDEGLNTAIKKLRQALLDSADSPIYIETLPRRGYRFIAPVTGAFVGPNENAGSISEEDAAGRNGAEASNRASEGAFGSKRGVLGRLSALRYIAFAAIVVVLAGIAIFVRYRATGHTAAIAASGTRLTRITQNGRVREMAISPNGQYVTYAVREGLTQSLWIREVRSGNELQLLAPDTVNFSGLAFSPDGASGYFIRSEKNNPVFSYLCRMPSAGGSVEQLIRDADSPVSSRQTANSSCTRAGIRAAISPRCALRTEMGRTTTCFSAWLGIRFMKRGPPGLRTTVWSRFRYISSAKNHVLSCMRFR